MVRPLTIVLYLSMALSEIKIMYLSITNYLILHVLLRSCYFIILEILKEKNMIRITRPSYFTIKIYHINLCTCIAHY